MPQHNHETRLGWIIGILGFVGLVWVERTFDRFPIGAFPLAGGCGMIAIGCGLTWWFWPEQRWWLGVIGIFSGVGALLFGYLAFIAAYLY
jgi:hypothetical protein